MNCLLRTIRDAIQFTRKLGIRYIWVDLLCIIQDDPENWAREAASMAQVYCNAYITIAATKSPDAEGGLFAKISQVCLGCNVDSDDSDGEPEQMCVARLDTPYIFSLDKPPLLQRG
jgi:hypothetical protein